MVTGVVVPLRGMKHGPCVSTIVDQGVIEIIVYEESNEFEVHISVICVSKKMYINGK